MYIHHDDKIAPNADIEFIAAARNFMPRLLAETPVEDCPIVLEASCTFSKSDRRHAPSPSLIGAVTHRRWLGGTSAWTEISTIASGS
jgi:hypothetical protein